MELLTQEDNDGTFVASFRALGDGETVVSFTYARDDALEEIRALNVTCKDGKVADVSNASVMPISGQDDPEITDLRNSNSIPMIMKEHSAVTCVSENWDGENNWQNKAVRQFVSSDGLCGMTTNSTMMLTRSYTARRDTSTMTFPVPCIPAKKTA